MCSSDVVKKYFPDLAQIQFPYFFHTFQDFSQIPYFFQTWKNKSHFPYFFQVSMIAYKPC